MIVRMPRRLIRLLLLLFLISKLQIFSNLFLYSNQDSNNELMFFCFSLPVCIQGLKTVQGGDSLNWNQERFCMFLQLITPNKLGGSTMAKKNFMKRALSTLLVLLLVFGNTALLGNAGVTANNDGSQLEPGEIAIDKFRSKYEPDNDGGYKTDVTLRVEAKGGTVHPPVDIVITIDVSNSMTNNHVMQPTENAAKNLAEQITEANSQSRVAIVRYADFASVWFPCQKSPL